MNLFGALGKNPQHGSKENDGAPSPSEGVASPGSACKAHHALGRGRTTGNGWCPARACHAGLPLAQGPNIPFEPRPQRRPIGTDLLRPPSDAPQGRFGEVFQGRPHDGRPSAPWGGGIAHPEAKTPGARHSALESLIDIPLRRDRHFFPLRPGPVHFPLTLRTALAEGQRRGGAYPETLSTGTVDFGGAGRLLILGPIHHLGSATPGAAQRRPLLLVGVDGTR